MRFKSINIYLIGYKDLRFFSDRARRPQLCIFRTLLLQNIYFYQIYSLSNLHMYRLIFEWPQHRRILSVLLWVFSLLSSSKQILLPHAPPTQEATGKNAENYNQAFQGLLLSVILGNYFTTLQAYEYLEASFTIADLVYGSIFFIVTGFHGLHGCNSQHSCLLFNMWEGYEVKVFVC